MELQAIDRKEETRSRQAPLPEALEESAIPNSSGGSRSPDLALHLSPQSNHSGYYWDSVPSYRLTVENVETFLAKTFGYYKFLTQIYEFRSLPI